MARLGYGQVGAMGLGASWASERCSCLQEWVSLEGLHGPFQPKLPCDSVVPQHIQFAFLAIRLKGFPLSPEPG